MYLYFFLNRNHLRQKL